MEQKFCRSCGFGLGKVARLIAEQPPDENLDSASGPKEGPSMGFRVCLLFFIIIFLPFSYYFIPTGRGGVFVSVVFISFLLAMLAFGTHIEFGRKRAGGQKSPQPGPATKAPTTKKLPPQPDQEMNASVTEQTTANLAERNERERDRANHGQSGGEK